jgi:hypothetical protein
MPDADLVTRVSLSCGLTAPEAARMISDIVAYYSEATEDFVRRRHSRLQALGMRNPAIFAQISAELGERVVAAPLLTERQLRRIIYG